ncbi:MAG: hypothetical protein JKY92_09155 [Magnetovibrio sp.]|nr:hypothetical protein [Magnetovibrio sp.]
MTMVEDGSKALLTPGEIEKVINGENDPVGNLILRDGDFTKIINRLRSNQSGYPALDNAGLRLVRDKIFNAPNAPVSFPFLWDMTRSDYVQWNGLASNAGGGPLGRNTGEVIGVFAILGWQKDTRWLTRLFGFSLSSLLSGQDKKKHQIYFKSSVDLFNLQRLESHLGKLESPAWPFCKNKKGNDYLPSSLPTDRNDFDKGCNSGDHQFDAKALEHGRVLYAQYCESCHELIIPDAWDRLMVSNMTKVNTKGRDDSTSIGTDKVMATNSVTFKGKSGNFKDTYQTVSVGPLVVTEDAPVVQVLTAAAAGTIGTPDADKWWPRRFAEYIYALGMTFLDNPVKESVKAGQYNPDTTSGPYNSLVSYRARSLNGIWATAPYLHNGSVPNLYELLLPPKHLDDVEGERCKKYRSSKGFMIGKREFDPENVGFVSQGYTDGFFFDTTIPGNTNTGHEYGACAMTNTQRMDLLEYLKSL